MFDIFKSLPKSEAPPMPPTKEPVSEPDPKVLLSIGITDDNRISLSVDGGRAVCMTKNATLGLIKTLEASIAMLDKEEEEDEETI